ncbi:hypothetical protein TraAM80_08049 [Trypanosoma rangeli]|uniref:Uncharacterized protein n=1 Tax=Trypanosoma rangeli TaxID=5698 RepID=A0A422N2E5_TRYRA|nr:uncharacterized protein TraAM80_08049 [Trypanosoma rangeli]RNE99625.1 hypothetical protein TraAM80_08049 [Trypanosoma rangeli]|eukprot:RNE99625.1 hypothetical protein TraAM80_08049 [Trypanosoma rangeli]
MPGEVEPKASQQSPCTPLQVSLLATRPEPSGSLHPKIAEFIHNPMLAIENLDMMKATETPLPPGEDANLLQDVQELRRRVSMMQEEVHAQRRAQTELEAQINSGKEEVLTQLYSDLSPPPHTPHAVTGNTSEGDVKADRLLVSVRDEFLYQVRKLEGQTALCRLNNAAKEEALRTLYAGILMEEEKQKECGAELQAAEEVCNTLRLKVQEAQQRVLDYRRREAFVSTAEGKYLEQMESIYSLREELRACGLRLPVLEAGGDVPGACIPTFNRFCWEQHCVRRSRAAKPPPFPEMESACFERKPTERDAKEEEDNPNATVLRVFAFPPGILRVLHRTMHSETHEGAECGGHLRSDVGNLPVGERKSGSGGLRQRARALGLSLQYQQHVEANPYLSRYPAAGNRDGCEKGANAVTNGVGVVIRGPWRAVEQFQRELEAAVAALKSSDGEEVCFHNLTSPSGEKRGIFADPTYVGGAASGSRFRHCDEHPVAPWKAAAELAQIHAAELSPRLEEGSGDAED